MRALSFFAAVVVSVGAAAALSMAGQLPAAPAPAAPAAASAAEASALIKQELDQIKKSRTVAISPAAGMETEDGSTLLRVENSSAFSIVVLLVGPTTERLELGPSRMQTVALDPGEYEIAVTAVGRDLPAFYGRQRVVGSMRYRHQFVIPAV